MKLHYPIEPGMIVPNPNGGDGNPFPLIIATIFVFAYLGHIQEGNVPAFRQDNSAPQVQPQQL